MNESDPRHDWMRQYAEGAASAETTAKLEQALREDASFRKLFIEYLNVDLALSTTAAFAEPVAEVKVVRFSKTSRKASWAWAAAAVVALLVTFSSFWFNQHRLNGGKDTGAGVIDPYLAIVVDQTPTARWSGTNAPRGLGHALGRDRCRLESGEARLQLDNGVELLLRAPAELQLRSVDHAILYRGQASVRVPKEAIGFRLDAPGLNVVDLGTEFSLAVDDRGQPQVHVFQGKVRAALPTLPSSRTELNTGESARFDVRQGKVTRGTGNLAVFPPLSDARNLPRTTGDVRFLRQAPESVLAGTFEHNAIMMFEESANFTLPANLTVVREMSNQQAGPEPSLAEEVTLSAGAQVRSYYVHFDRVGQGKRDVESRGSITFDQPVLGLAIRFQTLKQTDPWLAHAGTAYETSGNRLLEMRFMGIPGHPASPNTSGRYDEVHLSPDGRTVTIDLVTGWMVDQFRVLVKTEP